MSKMGEELDRKLSENKYEMWEALRGIIDMFESLRFKHEEYTPLVQRARQVLAKIEGK